MTEQNSQGKSSDTGTYDNVAETPISPSKDLISLLQDYEDGVLGPEETTQLFQELIDSGYAWQLQHHYGKTAREFILSGRCLPWNGAKRA